MKKSKPLEKDDNNRLVLVDYENNFRFKNDNDKLEKEKRKEIIELEKQIKNIEQEIDVIAEQSHRRIENRNEVFENNFPKVYANMINKQMTTDELRYFIDVFSWVEFKVYYLINGTECIFRNYLKLRFFDDELYFQDAYSSSCYHRSNVDNFSLKLISFDENIMKFELSMNGIFFTLYCGKPKENKYLAKNMIMNEEER